MSGEQTKVSSLNLNERLDAFRAEMFAKFKRVEHKHRGNSVTDDSIDWMTFDWAQIEDHFWEEVGEARKNHLDEKEWVDVANMAFLMWWWATKKREEINDVL